MVPIFQAAIILSNSIAGIVFFGDLRAETSLKKGMFCLGALASVAGVCILMLKTKGASAAAVAALEQGHHHVDSDVTVSVSAVTSHRKKTEDRITLIDEKNKEGQIDDGVLLTRMPLSSPRVDYGSVPVIFS